MKELKKSINDAKVEEATLSLAVIVRAEIEARKKHVPVSNDEVVKRVSERVREENKTFENAKRRDAYLKGVVSDVMWEYANTTEATPIIQRLKSNDQSFAMKFFYGTNPNGCNISRFRSKIIKNIQKTYHVEVSVREFGTLLYKHLWSENTWSVLEKYSHKSSIFSWLEEVSFHLIIKELKEQGQINDTHEPSASNSRLIKASVCPLAWQDIIDTCLTAPRSHDLMTAILVDCKTDSEVMGLFGLTEKEFNEARKHAEKRICQRLIDTDSPYGKLVIRNKKPQRIMVTGESIHNHAVWEEEQAEESPLIDVFGINLSIEERREKAADSFTISMKGSIGKSRLFRCGSSATSTIFHR